MDSVELHRLACANCDAVAPPDGCGWRAYPMGDEDAEHVEEIAIICPACAERELEGT